MTDEDNRQQRAMLLLEVREAEDELAHLEESAKRLAEDIRQVADWVESATYADFHQKMEIQERHARISSGGGSSRYSQALNIQRAMEAVMLVLGARKKVDDLKQRKASL